MTSPSPANIAYNGNITTWWIPATNLSALTATGVVSTLTIDPANGLKVITWETTNGTFNKTTGVWTIGTLSPGTTVWLKLVTEVIDIGLAPFELTYVLSGNNIDPNNVNNTGTQQLTSVVGAATAAAIGDFNACNCVDVTTNDIPCNVGVTEWRLNVPSLTNISSHYWDQTTGKGRFNLLNPFENGSFTYTIWCDTGSGFVQTSGPATVTISAMFDVINPWDHSLDVVEYSELSLADIAHIETIPKYTAITIADYCWRILRNGEGTLVSAEAVECTGQQDTRHFYFCSENECDPTPPTCTSCPNNQLPADAIAYLATIDNYVPEIGDTIKVQFTDAYSYYTYETLGWTRSSCSCVYKISQDAGNLLTLGTDNAPYISDDIILDAVDEKSKVSANDTTSGFLNGKLVAGTGITLTETNDGLNETLVIATTDTSGCLPINLTLTTVLGSPGQEAFLSVEGIDGTDPAWDEWEWQIADIYVNPKVWVNAQTGGLDFTIGTDDTTLRVKFERGDCVYYSNVTGLPETLYDEPNTIPFVEVYNPSQVFIEGSGATKLDFATATITNISFGKLSTSIANDWFVAVGAANTWEMSYSGHLTFETALASTQRIIIAAYLDGVVIPKSIQTIVVPEGTDYQIPFSKTWIQDIPSADTLDLRFSATLGDITALDTVLTLKSLTFTT